MDAEREVVFLLCTDGDNWTSVKHKVSADVEPDNLFEHFPRSSKPLHLADRILIVDSDGSIWLWKDRYSSTKPGKIVHGRR